tara:strand:- start:730 stop:1221 length:492 start_codon:yes stop_codon:yes gene_type:complete
MANEIRVRMSVDVLQDTSETTQGITYTAHQHEGNADSRSWGGNYKISTTYTDANVAYWKNVIVEDTSANGLENGDCFVDEPVVTDGTLPANVYCLAVEYVKEKGTVGKVNVKVSGELFAALAVGESIVIPMHMNEAIASCQLYADAYSLGTNEATVNVMVVGT